MKDERCAVVAVVMRVVVALLLAGIHAVGDGRVEQSLEAFDAANEAPAANEHDRVIAGLLAGETAPASVPAGDVGDFNAIATEKRTCAQHGQAILSDAHECPRPRER